MSWVAARQMVVRGSGHGAAAERRFPFSFNSDDDNLLRALTPDNNQNGHRQRSSGPITELIRLAAQALRLS